MYANEHNGHKNMENKERYTYTYTINIKISCRRMLSKLRYRSVIQFAKRTASTRTALRKKATSEFRTSASNDPAIIVLVKPGGKIGSNASSGKCI